MTAEGTRAAYKSLFDTGVQTAHLGYDAQSNRISGYTRQITMVGWTPEARLLGRAEVQVGPGIATSHARFSVWNGETFAVFLTLPIAEWWRDVPGWNRDPGAKHTQMTNRVIMQMVVLASFIAEESDL